ncbi:hypothetical protein [Brevundimonas sp.]
MTIWNPDRRPRQADAVYATLGYTAAAILSIGAWVVLASFMG